MEKSRRLICRNILFVLIAATLSAGCESRPCREPRDPDLDQTKVPAAASSTNGSSTSGAGTTIDPKSSALQNADGSTATRVRVFKPDGSRQCGKRGGKTVEVMERELAGITVYSREKRSDGLMHVQICGSPTGIINVYEIDLNTLKQAEERGFKRFED